MRSIQRIGFLAAGLAVGLVGAGHVAAGGQFSAATVNFEQNATDGDVEVVFTADSGGEGLARLSVTAPDGRPVVNFTGPPPPTLGLRQFRFESPEPEDDGSLRAAFPEGTYIFRGTTVGGKELESGAVLSHALPGVATLVHPEEDAEVSAEGLRIEWKSVPGVSVYVLEIESDETDATLAVSLPAPATSFAVPDGFLVPGLEYQLGIGTLTEDGNASFVEISFGTAE